MRSRSRIPLLLAAALLLVPLSACAALPGGGGDSAGSGALPSRELPGGEMAAEDSAASGIAEGLAPTAEGRAERSVIRTAQLSIEVADPEAAAEDVAGIAEASGGTVESQNVSRAGEQGGTSAELTLRVPADRLDEVFDAVKEVGQVIDQSRSASDVTEQHVDLQARVAALEESVERLQQLMAGADTTSELIEAETALAQRQQELDGLRAQLQSLEGQVDEATVWVSLSTRSALPGGGPANFWEGLLAGFDSLGVAGAGALVLLGVLLPWLVLAGLVAAAVVFIVRASKRRRARAAQAVVPTASGSAPAVPAPESPEHPVSPEPGASPENPGGPESPGRS
ncbi:DUF4349 domain-containing protein [Leucobacter massiliensis]|uniref:DUF4349 domain-containing protein n=1 Tax=Leucobacter massiliensis TaxID=1686285 RepID=A0A2S9QK75_9MICO|nr:DUF4349 domain-containing protein [Leucobacter massiliensis]PRI09985.1 hypothetical protein B4915_13745 [Leucobacter massiliensis]